MPFHRSKNAENCPSTVYNHSISHRQIDAKGFGPQVCMFGGRSRGRCVRSTQLWDLVMNRELPRQSFGFRLTVDRFSLFSLSAVSWIVGEKHYVFLYHVGITNFLWSLIPAFPHFSNRTTVVPEEKVLRDNRLAQSELEALRAELYWKKKLDTKWLGSVNFHWFLAIHGNPKYFMCGSIWCNGLQGKTSVF